MSLEAENGLTETKKTSSNQNFLTENCFTIKKSSAAESPLQNHTPAQRFLNAQLPINPQVQYIHADSARVLISSSNASIPARIAANSGGSR